MAIALAQKLRLVEIGHADRGAAGALRRDVGGIGADAALDPVGRLAARLVLAAVRQIAPGDVLQMALGAGADETDALPWVGPIRVAARARMHQRDFGASNLSAQFPKLRHLLLRTGGEIC